MPTITREQVDRVLQSVEYPADRDEILAQARRRRAGQALRSTLEQLPKQSYDSPAKARQQLERIEPALKKGRAPRKTTAQAAPAQGAEQQQLQLPEPVRQAAETVRVRGRQLAAQAGDQLAQQADQQRTTVATSLMETSRVVRESKARLEESQPPVAQILNFAATQLEAGASYLQRTEARQIVTQAQDLARRQPWLVFGVGALAGLLTVRLLKGADMQQLSQQVDGGGQQRTHNAVELLESDHLELRKLLRRGQSAVVDRRKATLRELKAKLQSHERMEEEVFYPALLENPATRDLVKTNFAEHKVVDEILSEIEATDPSDAEWSMRFKAMKMNLEAHAEDEEMDLFPLVRKSFTSGELRELGSRMSEIKQLASQAPA